MQGGGGPCDERVKAEVVQDISERELQRRHWYVIRRLDRSIWQLTRPYISVYAVFDYLARKYLERRRRSSRQQPSTTTSGFCSLFMLSQQISSLYSQYPVATQRLYLRHHHQRSMEGSNLSKSDAIVTASIKTRKINCAVYHESLSVLFFVVSCWEENEKKKRKKEGSFGVRTRDLLRVKQT